MTPLANFRTPALLRRTLTALAPIVCTDEVSELGLTGDVLAHAELSLRAFPGYVRLALVVGAAAFELGAVLLPSSRGRTFSRLPRARQEAYFRKWWASRFDGFRQLAKGMKALLALAYWEHPTVRNRLAYHPEQWIAEVAARRLRDYAADIRRADEIVLEPDPLIPAEQLKRHANVRSS
jgi:hypothetical protein